MNNPVNFELAKLLKEKKQNIFTTNLKYASNGKLCREIYDFDEWCFAPTIAEVVMWLYEKHGIWIVVIPKRKDKGLFWGGHIDTGKDEFMKSYGSNFNSPAEAYEAAIEYALKTLIKIK